MNELENVVGPVVGPLILARSGSCVLDENCQATLIAWTTKSAMLFEHTSRKEALRFYSADERARFVESLEPPKGVYIWLARYRGDLDAHSTVQNFIVTPEGGCSSEPVQIQVTTIMVRHLAFQVLAGRWPKGLGLDLDEVDGSVWQGFTLRLWPSLGGRARWPPAKRLSDEGLKLFTNRFRDVVPLASDDDGSPAISERWTIHYDSDT